MADQPAIAKPQKKLITKCYCGKDKVAWQNLFVVFTQNTCANISIVWNTDHTDTQTKIVTFLSWPLNEL